MGALSTKANLDQLKRLRALTKGTDVGDKISDITKKWYNGTNGASYKNGLDGYVDNWSDYMKNQRKYLDQASKKLKTYEQFIKTTIREFLNEGLDDTSWTGHNDKTVTLRQILDLTKDIKVQELKTEKLKNIVLSWDGNTEEIEKIEKSDIQYPVLILMNDDNTIKYILDGNHRIQKSIKHNLPTVKAKLIKFSNLPEDVQNILG